MRKFSIYLVITLCSIFAMNSTASQSHTLPSGEVLHDPTQPYGNKVKAVAKTKALRPKLTLNYIMSSGNSHRAMINGKKVRVGDTVSGAKVRKIASDYVSMEHDGKEFVLRLNKLVKIKK